MIHFQFQLLYKHQEQLCSVQFSDTFNSLETNKKYLVSGHPFEILKPVLSSESLLEFVVLQDGFFPLLHLSDEEMLPFDLRTKGWKLIQKMTSASWLETFSDIHNILPPLRPTSV